MAGNALATSTSSAGTANATLFRDEYDKSGDAVRNGIVENIGTYFTQQNVVRTVATKMGLLLKTQTLTMASKPPPDQQVLRQAVAEAFDVNYLKSAPRNDEYVVELKTKKRTKLLTAAMWWDYHVKNDKTRIEFWTKVAAKADDVYNNNLKDYLDSNSCLNPEQLSIFDAVIMAVENQQLLYFCGWPWRFRDLMKAVDPDLQNQPFGGK
ncbi:9626_t:CDS:2, partial [Paraglomus brasilianum]